jgi:hypothetical protein
VIWAGSKHAYVYVSLVCPSQTKNF